MKKNKNDSMPAWEKLHNNCKAAEESSFVPRLPPINIETMSQGQLREFFPLLMKIVKGKEDVETAKCKKPAWWPDDIPYSGAKIDIRFTETNLTEMLKKLVRSCYRHLGQEASLYPASGSRSKNSPLLHAYLSEQSKMVMSVEKRKKKKRATRYSEIFICYFCEKEFIDKADLRFHQNSCQERPPMSHDVCTPVKSDANNYASPRKVSPVKPTVEKLVLHRPPRETFVKKLFLVPQNKAAKIRASNRKSIDIDCDKIDLEEPISPTCMSPTTPRTQKTLISQLSREDHSAVSRKRLSYSESVVDNCDKESVVSGSTDDSDDKPSHKGKSLLMIELSSLLGQRVQKHISPETAFHVESNAENFCKTPEKNTFLSKLRHRISSFPIMYRPRKNVDLRHSHMYKFNKKQKKQFMIKMESGGLCRKSRLLKRSMSKCSVVLCEVSDVLLRKYLSEYSYNKFKGPPKQPIEECEAKSVFPKEPVMMSKDIDILLGLKKSSQTPWRRTTLSLENVVSEQMSAEVSKQKYTVYKSLLTDMSLYQSMKEIDRRNKNGKTLRSIKTEVEKIPPISLTKAVSDDNLSIISVSSDESSLKSSCCTGCRHAKLRNQRVSERSHLPWDSPLNIIPDSTSATEKIGRSPQISPCLSYISPSLSESETASSAKEETDLSISLKKKERENYKHKGKVDLKKLDCRSIPNIVYPPSPESCPSPSLSDMSKSDQNEKSPEKKSPRKTHSREKNADRAGIFVDLFNRNSPLTRSASISGNFSATGERLRRSKRQLSSSSLPGSPCKVRRMDL